MCCAKALRGLFLGNAIARRLKAVGSRWDWVARGGAVLLGKLQIARRRVMVGSRGQWVADGGAVLLGNANVGSL